MTDDPSSTTRRALLKHAVVGSTSVIGVQQISGDSRATGATSERSTDVTNELTADALISTVKSSTAYELYKGYFEEQENLVFSTDDPAVYEIQTRSTQAMYGITFDLVDHSSTVLGVIDTETSNTRSTTDATTDDQRVSADVTFRVEGSTVQESTALILERLDRNTTKGTKFWIVDGELKQESLTMTRSENTIKAVQAQDRVSTQSIFGVECGDCKDLMRSICQVGCAAPSSLICTVSTGGIGGIACGVAADLICSHTPIPDNCTSDTTHKHWQLCKEAGFC